jgi:hypothetical protein
MKPRPGRYVIIDDEPRYRQGLGEANGLRLVQVGGTDQLMTLSTFSGNPVMSLSLTCASTDRLATRPCFKVSARSGNSSAGSVTVSWFTQPSPTRAGGSLRRR